MRLRLLSHPFHTIDGWLPEHTIKRWRRPAIQAYIFLIPTTKARLLDKHLHISGISAQCSNNYLIRNEAPPAVDVSAAEAPLGQKVVQISHSFI